MERQIQPGESVTVAVVEAVSALEDRPPEALEPLHDVIRTDLDDVFGFETADPRTDRIRSFTFEYMDYYVTVENDATVSVEPKPERPFVSDVTVSV